MAQLTRSSFFEDLLNLGKTHSFDEKGFQKLFWEAFQEKGLPNKSFETYRYFPLSHFYQQEFDNRLESKEVVFSPLPETSQSCCLFVEGKFQKDSPLSDKRLAGCLILPLDQAQKTYGAFLQQRWKKNLKEEKDPLALLNGAFYESGLLIYIPPETHVEVPIEILQLSSSKGFLNPRIHVFVGKNSSVQFIARESLQQEAWLNEVYDFLLEEKSSVHFTQLCPEGVAWRSPAIRAHVKKGASFEAFTISGGGKGVRQDYQITLLEEEAEGQIQGLHLLEKNHQSHVNVLMEHVAPNCHSEQHFKGVLKDNSKASFEGKIYVHSQAQQTRAYQLSNYLLLSDDARANSKPNLEIFADDVKASHGATVGQLDEDQYLYCRMRGIPSDQAKCLLIQGFCQELAENISISSVSQYLSQNISQWIHGYSR